MTTARLFREGRELAAATTPTILAAPADAGELSTKWDALVVGPPATPYAFGFFHFTFSFPKDYPNAPPKVTATTTSANAVRFNPNVYASGKVCLSILGTWRGHSCEMWSAVQSISSVLTSIQSLLNDKPYHNEPSFEKDDGSGDVRRYSNKVAHETLRVGVCEVMEDSFNRRTSSPNGATPVFEHARRVLFLMYADRYLDECAKGERLCDKGTTEDGAAFKIMPFECKTNQMSGTFAWAAIAERLETLKSRALDEVNEWRRQGQQQTALIAEGHVSAVDSCISCLRQQEEHIKRGGIPAGTSVGADPHNACVWTVTIFGPSDTLWDGGMFEVEVVFPPCYPDAPPHIRFLTPIFHPQINSNGVPYLRALILWTCCDQRDRSIATLVEQLVALLATAPSPEPATHLNVAAASLLFSRDDEDHKEYKRQVKKCVQRSVEM